MIKVCRTSKKSMLALSFIAFAWIAFAMPLGAAMAAGPQVTPTVDYKDGNGFQLAGPTGGPASVFPSGVVQLGVFAVPSSGSKQLGCAVFGGSQIVKVVWDFDGGEPNSNLDFFSFTPTVVFPGNKQEYVVTAQVFEASKSTPKKCSGSTTITFFVTPLITIH